MSLQYLPLLRARRCPQSEDRADPNSFVVLSSTFESFATSTDETTMLRRGTALHRTMTCEIQLPELRKNFYAVVGKELSLEQAE